MSLNLSLFIVIIVMALLMGMSGVTASQEDIITGPVLDTDTELVNSSHITLKPGDLTPVKPEDGFIVLSRDKIKEGPIIGTPFSEGMQTRGNYFIIPIPCQVTWTIVPERTTGDVVGMISTLMMGHMFI
jgi:hypothetical protein